MTPSENELAFFRPSIRPLETLSNEELREIYRLRADKVAGTLDPKGFWDNNRIVYWNGMIPRLMELYEVLLEIQSRYPKNEAGKWFDTRLLPVPELDWVTRAMKHLNKLPVGLKELESGTKPQPKGKGTEQEVTHKRRN